MKDVRDVLCQKEKDVERVHREIRALLTVIPLLDPVSEDVMSPLALAPVERVDQPTNNGMADLETYYPFVRHMRLSERA
jgi:hypothetical protein